MSSAEGIIIFTTPTEAQNLLEASLDVEFGLAELSEFNAVRSGRRRIEPHAAAVSATEFVTTTYPSCANEVLHHYRFLLRLLCERFWYETELRGSAVSTFEPFSSKQADLNRPPDTAAYLRFLQATALPANAAGKTDELYGANNVFLAHLPQSELEEPSCYFVDMNDIYTFIPRTLEDGTGALESLARYGCGIQRGKRRASSEIVSTPRDNVPKGSHLIFASTAKKAKLEEAAGELRLFTHPILEAAWKRFFFLASALMPEQNNDNPELKRSNTEGLPKVIVVVLCDEDFALYAATDSTFMLPELRSVLSSNPTSSKKLDNEEVLSGGDLTITAFQSDDHFTVKGYPRILYRRGVQTGGDSQVDNTLSTLPRWMMPNETAALRPFSSPLAGVQVVRSSFVIHSLHFGIWCPVADFTWRATYYSGKSNQPLQRRGTPISAKNDHDVLSTGEVAHIASMNSLDRLIQDALADCLPNGGIEVSHRLSVTTTNSPVRSPTLANRIAKENHLFTDTPFSSHQNVFEHKNACQVPEGSVLSPWGWISHTHLRQICQRMLLCLLPHASTDSRENSLHCFPCVFESKSDERQDLTTLFHEDVTRALRYIDKKYVEAKKLSYRAVFKPNHEKISDRLWLCHEVLQQQFFPSSSHRMFDEIEEAEQKESRRFPACAVGQSDLEEYILAQLQDLATSPQAAVSRNLCCLEKLAPWDALSQRRARLASLSLHNIDFSSKWLRFFLQAPCISLVALAQSLEPGFDKNLQSCPMGMSDRTSAHGDEVKACELADLAQLVFLTSVLPSHTTGRSRKSTDKAPAAVSTSQGGAHSSRFTPTSLGLLDNEVGQAIAAAASSFYYPEANTDAKASQTSREPAMGCATLPPYHTDTVEKERPATSWAFQRAFSEVGDFEVETVQGEEVEFPARGASARRSVLSWLQQQAVCFAVQLDQPNTRHLIRLLHCFMEKAMDSFNGQPRDAAGAAGVTYDRDEKTPAYLPPSQMPPVALAALQQYWDHIAEEANRIMTDFLQEEQAIFHKLTANTESMVCATTDASAAASEDHEGGGIPSLDQDEGEAMISLKPQAPTTAACKTEAEACSYPLTGFEALKIFLQQVALNSSTNSYAPPLNNNTGGKSDDGSRCIPELSRTPQEKGVDNTHWLQHALFILSHGAVDELNYVSEKDVLSMARRALEKEMEDNCSGSGCKQKASTIPIKTGIFRSLQQKRNANKARTARQSPPGALTIPYACDLAVMRAARTHFLAFSEAIVTAYSAFSDRLHMTCSAETP